MRTILCFFALALLAGVLSTASTQPDFSVNGVTDFISDISASMAARDRNHDGLLDAGELQNLAWMLLPEVKLDRNNDRQLSEEELRDGVGRLSRDIFPSHPAPPSMRLAPAFEPEATLRQAPVKLKATAWAVETLIPDATLESATGEARPLRSLAGPRGTVIAVVSHSCPISQRYEATLARLEHEYTARGLGFCRLAAPGEEDAEAYRDPTGALLGALHATRTTDVFVLDAAQTLLYRGAIDDQYGQGYSRARPTQRFLVEALEALLSDRRPAVAATEAPGCELELPIAPETAREVTWHNRISRLVQANCATCHRTGGVAPFSLETYAQFLKKAGTVRRVVNDGLMPPWFAAAAPAGMHTPWWNERSLPARDQADLLAWLAGGRPEGDPADAPLPRLWSDEWQMGPPDLVVQIPKPVSVPAEGILPYHNVMVDTGLTETKWVSGWEIRPTARSVVHQCPGLRL